MKKLTIAITMVALVPLAQGLAVDAAAAEITGDPCYDNLAALANADQLDKDTPTMQGHPLSEDMCSKDPNNAAEELTEMTYLLPNTRGGVYTPNAENLFNPACPGGTRGLDTDGDGTLDAMDSDDDCDRIHDDAESSVRGNRVIRDTDGDGVMDGFDIKPNGNALLKVLAKEVSVTKMDVGVSESKRWADPFLAESLIYTRQGADPIVVEIPGLRETSNDHPHNTQIVTLPAFTFDNVDIPDDIWKFAPSGVGSYPSVELRLKLMDHDRDHDNKIDIGDQAGKSTVQLLFTLMQLLNGAGDFTLDGTADGVSDKSGTLKLGISTTALECAISAATRASSGNDSLVTVGDLNC